MSLGAIDLSKRVPEMAFGFSQPIESRVNDMIAGVKSDVAICLHGDDLIATE
jgi:heavy metal efflux system protein